MISLVSLQCYVTSRECRTTIRPRGFQMLSLLQRSLWNPSISEFLYVIQQRPIKKLWLEVCAKAKARRVHQIESPKCDFFRKIPKPDFAFHFNLNRNSNTLHIWRALAMDIMDTLPSSKESIFFSIFSPFFHHCLMTLRVNYIKVIFSNKLVASC